MSEYRVPAGAHEPLRARVRDLARASESPVVAALLAEEPLPDVSADAAAVVDAIREKQRYRAGVHALLSEYSLSSREGVLLMCLAEALLRVPDPLTADRLIRDKLSLGDWRAHVGAGPGLFVNASAWGLLLTGRFVALRQQDDDSPWGLLRDLVARAGEPAIRAAMRLAVRILGTQFVLGTDVAEALEKSAEEEARGYRYSYDLLGEAARTEAYARAHFDAYARAIETLGARTNANDPVRAPGFSVKLSALHPRYELAQQERLERELVPRVRELARLAREHGLGLTLDAEEASRLEPALAIFERVFDDPALVGWDGFGIAVQAYLKNAPAVIEWLGEQSARRRRRIPVRLVKGAYWDAEIKHAQVRGHVAYPVFTRKASSDLAYLACARRLLARRDRFFPQFATHNAHTALAVLAQARDQGGFEFQRLHGMGEELYAELREARGLSVGCRIYAPVGVHRELLAYLVRRLLENGANSSFVHNLADESVPTTTLARDPRDRLLASRALANPGIPTPPHLFGAKRRNSRGVDFADGDALERLASGSARWRAALRRAGDPAGTPGARDVVCPADRGVVLGHYRRSEPEEALRALGRVDAGFAEWSGAPVRARADALRRAADLFEAHADELLGGCVLEAGKTLRDAHDDVREAVDFCRDYALEAEALAARHPDARARGPFLCISPWNFPAAIFVGQIAAALAAGNTVLAKPAEQSTLVASRLLELLHEAGVPRGVLALLRGPGAPIAAPLLSDARLAGVMFTGSTEVARALAAALAEREGERVPLVAETGGQNALVVDSSALPEQVVDDVLASGFHSAGQRCSALRVLYVQDSIADPLLEMLAGALRELRIGDPADPATDVGPIIDAEARARLERHVESLAGHARLLFACELPARAAAGTFFAPRLYEIDSIERLDRELFGPIVHVIRYAASELDDLPRRLRATGYGLTFGVHSRIDESIERLARSVSAGNVYVNRNLVGAVVGVQPFGGRGLSGTGPKAGGPFTLLRLVRAAQASRSRPPLPAGERVDGAAEVARCEPVVRRLREAVGEPAARVAWAQRLAERIAADPALEPRERTALAARLRALADDASALFAPRTLGGPTGESNRFVVEPRGVFACPLREGARRADALLPAVAALLGGNAALLLPDPASEGLAREVRDRLEQAEFPASATALHVVRGPEVVATLLRACEIDGVACAGDAEHARLASRALAARPGAILPVIDSNSSLDLPRFVHEKTISVNTAASGGNAALLSQDEPD